MPMPKGRKSKNGYATTAALPNGGDDYKLIAQKCSDFGHKMNHSTARNVLLHAMAKIAYSLRETHGLSTDRESLFENALNPVFQEGVAEIIKEKLYK